MLEMAGQVFQPEIPPPFEGEELFVRENESGNLVAVVLRSGQFQVAELRGNPPSYRYVAGGKSVIETERRYASFLKSDGPEFDPLPEESKMDGLFLHLFEATHAFRNGKIVLKDANGGIA